MVKPTSHLQEFKSNYCACTETTIITIEESLCIGGHLLHTDENEREGNTRVRSWSRFCVRVIAYKRDAINIIEKSLGTVGKSSATRTLSSTEMKMKTIEEHVHAHSQLLPSRSK